MAYKPVGADENGKFPPRVETAIGAKVAAGTVGFLRDTDPRLPTNVDSAEYLDMTVDANGRISEATKTNGRKYLPQADIAEAAIGTATATNLTATSLTAANFTQAGQTLSAVTGAEYSQITTDAEGRIAEDALDAGGRVPAWILDAWVARMAPSLRATLGVAPELKLASWGDSMTFGLNGAGTTFPATAATDLGWSHYNGGISSQTSTEVAIRQGGLDVPLTVTGNTIPASGAVTVTAISPSSSWRAATALSFPGTLVGIPGTLAKSTAEVWTFTRTSAGTATTCPAGSRFISSTASPYNNWVTTIWVGRNNTSSQANIERDVAAMVGSLAPVKPRYLVFSILNSGTEPSGSAGYNAVMGINNALAATYGNKFFDVRRYLIDYGLSAAGIAPTAADTTAIAEDRVPASLMSDNLHLTPAGYAVVGHRVAAIITEKGWKL